MILIDRDELPIVARGKNHHRKYVFADITDAPTIDAIPVEWLKDMQRESLSENDRTMVGAIEAIFIEWHIYVNRLREMNRQQEQEAQDGKNRKMGKDER